MGGAENGHKSFACCCTAAPPPPPFTPRNLPSLQITASSQGVWAQIDSNCVGISNILRSVMGEGIVRSNEKVENTDLMAFDKMRLDVERLVRDYKDILELKIRFNVTPDSLNKYPGLVHFLYVDRYRDTVICPTLDAIDPSDVIGECGEG